ncbi:uncharacterized protein LOC110461386 [Mizuhopecten yessoensis]|uniref:Uncharacterized protein n=1 Tax=Mizuhopecten yessoensis TaxID=6573 RepID=A0A210R2X5_MIZYE|nr:uncharacterized protein LOC110461386 [Mizuhopecten yessoensis]OWF55327.1 hypothetical protein KP79_PYT20919 [Mizuhopecten yessoensis]
MVISEMLKDSFIVGYNINEDQDDNGGDIEKPDKTSRSPESPNLYIMSSDKQRILDDTDHELQHASILSSGSSTTTTSCVRVDIGDMDGEESMNLTTTSLKLCKRQVLRPYWRLLMFIGWRGFGRESVNSGHRGWFYLNILYPVFIVILLLYTYVYEVVACQWKLNIHKDTQFVPTTTMLPSTIPASNTTPPFINELTFSPAESIMTLNLSKLHHAHAQPPEACEHIITTYVIPNVLHFIAYIMGMYHFRIQENEQLYALMEKVFLQATPLYNRSISQQKMIRKLRLFLAVGGFWVGVTLGMQGLYEWAFDFPALAFFRKTGKVAHWVLFIVELLGIMVLNSVSLAVIANYVTQCEMTLFYIRGLALRLQEKSTEIKAAMKDLFVVKQNLSLLNGPIARMTSLVAVIFAELIIIGISILVLNKNNSPKVWTYRSIFPLVWASMLICPLYQAAKVNSVCNGIKKIAVEMRVFGYKGSSQLELDSFLGFVSQVQLKAKIFSIPVMPSYLISILVLTSFILLILFQTSIIGPVNYWFLLQEYGLCQFLLILFQTSIIGPVNYWFLLQEYGLSQFLLILFQTSTIGPVNYWF